MDTFDDKNTITSPLLCKEEEEDADEEVASVSSGVVIADPATMVDVKEEDEEMDVEKAEEEAPEITSTVVAEAVATTAKDDINIGKHKYGRNVLEKQNSHLQEEDHSDDHAYVLAEDIMEESTSLLPPPVVVEEDANLARRGQVQPVKYRDWPYAILFWTQFLSIAIYGIVCFAVLSSESNDAGGSMSNHEDGVDFMIDNEVMILYGSTLPLLLSFCFVFLFTLLFNSQRNIERLIFASQCLIILSTVLVTISFLLQGLYLACFLGSLSTVWGIWYLIAIQNRIPFAAANLNSGFHAVRSNKGVILVAALHWMVFAGWLVLWCTSLYNAVGAVQVCDDQYDASSCEMQVTRPGWILPWVFSLFWTVQVVKYTVQTIVAGVSATWYFTPQEASSFCSSAVRSSIQRSLTTSFGSVCLGALLVAVIQFLDWLVKNLRMRRSESREHGGGGAAVEALLLCCLDCILSLMEDIVQYFNKWVSHGAICCFSYGCIWEYTL